jgi:hypothetical protein
MELSVERFVVHWCTNPAVYLLCVDAVQHYLHWTCIPDTEQVQILPLFSVYKLGLEW